MNVSEPSHILQSHVGKICLFQLVPQVPYSIVSSTPDARSPMGVLFRIIQEPGKPPVTKGMELTAHLLGKLKEVDADYVQIECADAGNPAKVQIISAARSAVIFVTEVTEGSKLVGVGTEAVGPIPAQLGIPA